MMRICGDHCMKMFGLNLWWKSGSEQTLGNCRSWIKRCGRFRISWKNGGRRPKVFRDYHFHHYDLVREYFGCAGFTDENGEEWPRIRAAQYDHKFRLRFRK